jgi:hypothetical protein
MGTDNDESLVDDDDKIKDLLSAFDEIDRRVIMKVPAAQVIMINFKK